MTKKQSTLKLKALTFNHVFYALIILFGICLSSQIYANTTQPKAKWYRYYDKKGIANISTSVSPEHIRHGYEALDQNMQVIKKSKAYNSDKEENQSTLRSEQAKQYEADVKLKRAYGNSRTAVGKRDDTLRNISKQIEFQKQQYQQLDKDRLLFKREELTYTKKGQTVPKNLRDRLTYNSQNMESIKKNIESLQANYTNTQAQYENIIQRLKTLE